MNTRSGTEHLERRRDTMEVAWRGLGPFPIDSPPPSAKKKKKKNARALLLGSLDLIKRCPRMRFCRPPAAAGYLKDFHCGQWEAASAVRIILGFLESAG